MDSVSSSQTIEANNPKPATRRRFRLSFYLGVLALLYRGMLHLLARSLPAALRLGPFLHRLRGVKIYGSVWIGDDVYIDEDFPGTVEIHDGVQIATRCTIIGHTKGSGRIVIEKGAAIGAGCVIVCASGQTLTIGEGALISAGSTVSHSVPPYTLCGAARLKAYGRMTRPLLFNDTYEEFRRSLRPLRSSNGARKPS